jgi:hypothetical protein
LHDPISLCCFGFGKGDEHVRLTLPIINTNKPFQVWTRNCQKPFASG